MNIASVALDLPGFGSSPPPTVAGGARLYADWLIPTLRELADEPLVLVGHSFGGRIAAVVASAHPELVRAVVLSGAPLLKRAATVPSPWGYRTVRWLHARSLVSDDRMESARQRYGSLDYRQARGIVRDVLVATVNESYEEELAGLAVPVSMLWGELDQEVPVDVAINAGALISAAHSLRVVPGVGHLVPIEAPHELVRSVCEILR